MDRWKEYTPYTRSYSKIIQPPKNCPPDGTDQIYSRSATRPSGTQNYTLDKCANGHQTDL